MFAHERAEIDVFGLLYFGLVLVFCFHRTSILSLDHAQSCKSEIASFSSCFQVCQTKSLESFFAERARIHTYAEKEEEEKKNKKK